MHHRVKSPPVAEGNSPSERWRSRCPQGRFAGFFCLFGLSRIDPRTAVGHSGVAAPSDSFRDILMEARRDSLPQQMTPEPDKQSAWDRPLVDADKEEVRRGASGLVEHARLDAVCK